MVLGKAYKENVILILFIYIFLVVASIAGIVLISIFVDKLSYKIISITSISLLIILFSLMPFYVYKCKKTPKDIIIYNDLDETLTINLYNKKHVVKTSNICVINVHNMGNRMIFTNKLEEGKLSFYLNDGTKIKTSEIVDVYDVYDKLEKIVFKDREYDEEVKEQLIVKLDGWGARKEYPSIVSVLVALFLPFFGLFFVNNQKEFKELKNGKATGLMGVAFVISAFWVLAIIVVLFLL